MQKKEIKSSLSHTPVHTEGREEGRERGGGELEIRILLLP